MSNGIQRDAMGMERLARSDRSTPVLSSTDPVEQDEIQPVIEVTDLSIDFRVDDDWVAAVRNVSYRVLPGEVLALVGESGSGKSVSSLALLGLLPSNTRATGSVRFRGHEILTASESALRGIRGDEIALIFQEPMTALNPVLRIGHQIVYALRAHGKMSRKRAKQRALELLGLVELPDPEKAYRSYPHQLSGGQRQRALIAQAISCDPVLLVADEPTTALDVTIQAEILELLRRLRSHLNSAVVLITHDLGVVADIAEHVVVMRAGSVVESGMVDDVFEHPADPYTQELFAAVPRLNTIDPPLVATNGEEPLIVQATGAVIDYSARGGARSHRAVDDVDFEIRRGEIVGLVGESGSGKTTIARGLIGLQPFTSGSVELFGTQMVGVGARSLRDIRKRIGVVFQDPGSSLNPRRSIGKSIAEPMKIAGGYTPEAIKRRVEQVLEEVHLPPNFYSRFPHELSGGQRQRVGIARALVLRPELLIADEPTSALDVSIQEKVLTILEELQSQFRFACLFVSHDLAVVDRLADRVLVLNHGLLVESGTPAQVVRNPQHPYTQRLIAAIPVPDPKEQRRRRDRRLQPASSDAGRDARR